MVSRQRWVVVAVMLGAFGGHFTPAHAQVGAWQSVADAPLPDGEQRTYGIVGASSGERIDADLMLNCNGQEPTEVVPVFFAGGRARVGTPLVLAPNSMQWISLADLTPDPVEAVELRYRGQVQRVAAQLTLRPQGRSGTVDSTMVGPLEFRSRTLEGVWWMPPAARARVTVANASDEGVVVTVRGTDTSGPRRFRLAPRATQLLTLPGGPGRQAGSLRLEHTGVPGSVRAGGWVEAAEKGQRILGSVRFYDPANARHEDLFATNVPGGDRELHVTLKNTTADPVRAVVRAISMTSADTTPFEIATLQLAPFEAARVEMESLQRAALSDEALQKVSLRVESSGTPGSVIGAIAAVDAAGLAQDIPLRDRGPVRRSTGTYPWRLDGDFETVVSITNVGDVEAWYLGRITYEGGVYWIAARQLAPGASAVYDMRALRNRQVPDRDGQVLPVTATRGQFRWSIVGPINGARLNGRSEIRSVAQGTARSYSCGQCCPGRFNGQSFLQPIPVQTPIGWSNQFQILERHEDCFGAGGDLWFGLPHAWSVQDPAITAARTITWGVGEVDGLSEGRTWVTGFWTTTDYQPYFEDCRGVPVDTSASTEADVRRPAVLRVISDRYAWQAFNDYKRERVYQVLDQYGQPLARAGMTATETFSDWITNGCELSGLSPRHASTNDQGRFLDEIGITNQPKCRVDPNCSSTIIQTARIDLLIVGQFTFTYRCGSVDITP